MRVWNLKTFSRFCLMSFDDFKELLLSLLNDGHELDAFIKNDTGEAFFVSINMAVVELEGELYLRDCHFNLFALDDDIWKPKNIVVEADKVSCQVIFTNDEYWTLNIYTDEEINLIEYKENL